MFPIWTDSWCCTLKMSLSETMSECFVSMFRHKSTDTNYDLQVSESLLSIELCYQSLTSYFQDQYMSWEEVDFFHLRQFLTKLGLFCSLDCSQGTYELLNNCLFHLLSDQVWTVSPQFPSCSPFIWAVVVTLLLHEFVSGNSFKSLTVLTSLNILTIWLHLI